MVRDVLEWTGRGGDRSTHTNAGGGEEAKATLPVKAKSGTSQADKLTTKLRLRGLQESTAGVREGGQEGEETTLAVQHPLLGSQDAASWG